MRLSSVPPYRWFAKVYVEIFRGCRADHLIFIGTGIPLAFPGAKFPPGGTTGKVAFASARRGGLHGGDVPRRHPGGAEGTGGGSPVARHVEHARDAVDRDPAAFRIIIPPLTNELVLLFKDSSLVFCSASSCREGAREVRAGHGGSKANATPCSSRRCATC
jgi:polar amino acid transport system permease protein